MKIIRLILTGAIVTFASIATAQNEAASSPAAAPSAQGGSNDAIVKMQKEVRKNPKNEAARQVLRSSYQNKIDLLNSVAEKTELMASIR